VRGPAGPGSDAGTFGRPRPAIGAFRGGGAARPHLSPLEARDGDGSEYPRRAQERDTGRGDLSNRPPHGLLSPLVPAVLPRSRHRAIAALNLILLNGACHTVICRRRSRPFTASSPSDAICGMSCPIRSAIFARLLEAAHRGPSVGAHATGAFRAHHGWRAAGSGWSVAGGPVRGLERQAELRRAVIGGGIAGLSAAYMQTDPKLT
jgi:hypothetical protein